MIMKGCERKCVYSVYAVRCWKSDKAKTEIITHQCSDVMAITRSNHLSITNDTRKENVNVLKERTLRCSLSKSILAYVCVRVSVCLCPPARALATAGFCVIIMYYYFIYWFCCIYCQTRSSLGWYYVFLSCFVLGPHWSHRYTLRSGRKFHLARLVRHVELEGNYLN